MVLSRLHRAQIKIVDLAILALTLVLITNSISLQGTVIQILTMSFTTLLIIVGTVYFVICLFVGIICASINTVSWFGRIAKVLISTLLMLLLFPVIIQFVMAICQYELIANAQEILFYAVLIRTLVRAILGRYWKEAIP